MSAVRAAVWDTPPLGRLVRFVRRHTNGRRRIVFFAAALGALTCSSPAQAGGIVWQKDYGHALRQAEHQRKPVLVVVEARWCGACRKMLRESFSNPVVAARVGSRFIPLQIDSDKQPVLVQSLKVDALPTVIVISPDRRIIGRMVGFRSAAQLEAWLAGFEAVRPTPAPPTPRKEQFQQESPRVRPPAPLASFAPVPRPPLDPDAPIPMPPPERLSQHLDTLAAALRFSAGG